MKVEQQDPSRQNSEAIGNKEDDICKGRPFGGLEAERRPRGLSPEEVSPSLQDPGRESRCPGATAHRSATPKQQKSPKASERQPSTASTCCTWYLGQTMGSQSCYQLHTLDRAMNPCAKAGLSSTNYRYYCFHFSALGFATSLATTPGGMKLPFVGHTRTPRAIKLLLVPVAVMPVLSP
jgi:hypothetical protein